MPLRVAAELETKRYLPSRLSVQAAGWLKPVSVWTHLALMRSGLIGPGTSTKESAVALTLRENEGVAVACVEGAAAFASGSVPAVELMPASRLQAWSAAAAQTSQAGKAAVGLR